MNFDVIGERFELKQYEKVEGWNGWFNPDVGWAKLLGIDDSDFYKDKPDSGGKYRVGYPENQHLELKILDEDVQKQFDMMKKDIEKKAKRAVKRIKTDHDLNEYISKIRKKRYKTSAFSSIDNFIKRYLSWVYEGEVERMFRNMNYNWDDYFVLADMASIIVHRGKGDKSVVTLGEYGYITNDMKCGSFNGVCLEEKTEEVEQSNV